MGDYGTNPNGHFSTPLDIAKALSGDATVGSGCVGPWDVNLPKCLVYDSKLVTQAITPRTQLIFVTLGTGNSVDDSYICNQLLMVILKIVVCVSHCVNLDLLSCAWRVSF